MIGAGLRRRLRAPRSGGAQPARAFHQVRNFSTELSADLAPEDCVVQSMPDVSPTKWHLAHTTWFFETFILKKWMRAIARDPAIRLSL